MILRRSNGRLKTKKGFESYFGLGGLGLLSVIILMLVFPVCQINTHAIFSSRTIITPSVSIAMTEPSSIDITPNGDGQFGATSSKLQVATTNSAGYSIYLNTIDKTNAMVNVQQQDTKQINAISTAQYAKDFTANTWGFALAREKNEMVAGGSGESISKSNNSASSETLATDLLYHPVPTTSNLIASASRATETDTYTLTFGANIDTALPAGQYANTVLVSVVANPQTIRSLSELTYMQEMSSLTCENSSLHETKQLIDSRDNQSYWVAKLADGNCWMVQNLALDLNEKTLPLKPESSDVNEEWRSASNTESTIPNLDKSSDFNSTRSWNLGKYVIKTPDTVAACAAINSGQSISACQSLVNVSGGEWNSANLGSGNSISGTNYNAHYLIGNYYQWNTAAVGNAAEATMTGDWYRTSDSICPKGWRLPKGDFGNLGDFAKLLVAYGYDTTGWYQAIKNSIVGTDETGEISQYPTLNPMYFVRGGYVELETGTYRNAGYHSINQSDMVHVKSLLVQSLVFDSTNISPIDHKGMLNGHTVRCVAR